VLPDISGFPPLFYRTVMGEVPAGFRVAVSRFVATGTITILSFLISHEVLDGTPLFVDLLKMRANHRVARLTPTPSAVSPSRPPIPNPSSSP